MKNFNSRSELLRMIQRYVSGSANEQEKRFLEAYYDYFEHEEDIFGQLSGEEQQKFESELAEVLNRQSVAPVIPIWRSFRAVSAAAVLILLSAGLYLYNNTESLPKVSNSEVRAVNIENDIAPGGSIAILTLADGTKINLNDADNGRIAQQAGIQISKQADGKLVYTLAKSTGESAALQNLYNTIETPRGGEYQVNLPDGTRVWLNAASSLRYPAAFSQTERKVWLNGEAYFEVAPNKKMPFLVESEHQLVEVVGTHFNVNSYPDEAVVRTTLLEGSVKVSASKGAAAHFLKPGQQASINPAAGSVSIHNVDVEEAIAWKNGYFIFSNESIRSIMRKVSRWYNVEVEYAGAISNEKFGGNVSKSKNISEVLRILELTKVVNFKVEGRRVIVMP